MGDYDYIGYIAVPHWDGEKWQPYDHRPAGDPQLFIWPEGFDPATIPPPRANLGELIRFDWGGPIGQGNVREIHRRGGAFTKIELACAKSEAAIARERYLDDRVTYIVTWNGHLRYVSERSLLPAKIA
jgi:hypothetical protein